MKNDRFLIAILAGIAILAVAAVAVFLMRRGQADYLPDDTPSGVVHNYALAVQRGDYERAYEYLGQLDNMPDLDAFELAFTSRQLDLSTYGLRVVGESEAGGSARVNLELSSGGGWLSDVSRWTDTAQLERQDDEWKITYMPYPYFAWEWTEPGASIPGKEIPAVPVD